MLTLHGRTRRKTVELQIDRTILEQAIKHKVDWSYNCTRGTCARCRCIIIEGGQFLNRPTDAEWDRLDEDEIEQGYRLGCQARVERSGTIVAVNKPYF